MVELKPYLIMGASALALLVMYWVDRRRLRKRPVTDEEMLSSIALSRGSSVYRIFQHAGEVWAFPAGRVEEDFRTYLTRGTIPHYVRDFIRKEIDPRDLAYGSMLNPGGNLPRSGSV